MRTFQKFPTFFCHLYDTFWSFMHRMAGTKCFRTNIYGIFLSNQRKNHPKYDISLVKYQIFLLLKTIFPGTWLAIRNNSLDILFCVPLIVSDSHFQVPLIVPYSHFYMPLIVPDSHSYVPHQCKEFQFFLNPVRTTNMSLN